MGPKTFTMKNFRPCLCQLLLLVLPIAVSGALFPVDISEISKQVEQTLSQIKQYIISSTDGDVAVNSLAPISITATKDVAVENALSGYRYLETAKGLLDQYFIEPDRVGSYLASVIPPRSLLETCDYITKINCDPHLQYRTLDGSCNNLINPYLGKGSTPFQRFLPPMYADGLSDPRTHSFFGIRLPRPRALSSALHQNGGYLNEDKGLTNLATVFGIFLNHDLHKVETLNMKDCCQIQREFQLYSMRFPLYSREGYEVLLSMSRAIKSVCMAIEIPASDQYFSFYNRKCMQYSRSTSTPHLNCKLSPREQRNTNTHFLDASQIYGSNSITMRGLRNGTKGLMSIFPDSKNGDLLPQDIANTVKCPLPNPNPNKIYCFKAGDTRANDQPTIITLYTLFAREHNRVAKTLAFINPTWNDERLFQEARKIVIAELQHIVYNEYLPVILGTNIMNTYGLTLKSTGYKNDYSNHTNPVIRGAFTSVMDMTIATLSRATFNANGRSNKLSSSYQNPSVFYKNVNTVDSIVGEMLKEKSQKFDRLMTDELTNRYKETVPGEGFDLAATTIQRSRDHGLPVYLAWLLLCGFKTPMEFSQLPFHDLEAKRKLSNMYVSVYDLDLVTAGVMETPLPGAKVGPTFACIIGRQFQQLKNGDRFWYENTGVGNFSENQLSEIRKINFATLICENTNITSIQRNVFLPESPSNPRVNCKDLTILDPCIWRLTSGWTDFTQWTACIGGARIRFRTCTLNPDGPCTCLGNPIELERCPTDGKISNIISKEKFNIVKTILLRAVKNGKIRPNPRLSELTAILRYTLREAELK